MTAQIDQLAQSIEARTHALPDKSVDPVRELRKEFSKQIAKWPAEDVVALGLKLVALPDFLFRFIAYELIAGHKAARQSLDEAALLKLGQGLDRWEAVDTFAPYLSGVAWREGQISDDVIHGWARSEDRWWRRAALVSTIALNTKARGGKGDAPRTLEVCRLLVHDRDDMVVKAMSWALRELIPYDPAAVRDFLSVHQSVLPARVIRETNNKLSTGVKNPKKG